MKLNEIMNGAVQELFANDLQKVFENIRDINTSIKKARKLTIEFTFKPLQDDREIITTEIKTKTTLANIEGVSTQILIDNDGNKLNAVELNRDVMKGQQSIEEVLILQDKLQENIITFKAN